MTFSDTKKQLLASDREECEMRASEQRDDAAAFLQAIGQVLSNAEHMLDDAMDNSDRLGSAMQRFTNDLADGLHDIAMSVRKEREESDGADYAVKYRIHFEDAQHAAQSATQNAESKIEADQSHQQPYSISNLSNEDIMEAVNSAETLLLDVEDALRSVTKDEAQEMGEVAISVAHMFVWMLQCVHSTITPDELLQNGRHSFDKHKDDGRIEILNEEDAGILNHHDNNDERETRENGTKTYSSSSDAPRMRVLWPPLAPAAIEAGKNGVDCAKDRPLLAVALALVLWPTALFTAFIAGPILTTDWLVQKGYDAVADGPIVTNIEQGAAGAFQLGRLYFLCGKLVIKQGIRVGKRQIDRRGGVQNVLQDLGGQVLGCVMNPVQTVGTVIDGARGGIDAIGGFISTVNSMQQHGVAGSSGMNSDNRVAETIFL
mmetsp:Transcript_22940/g.35312  ORF Transcript_22940/g.35312 Transcript_22940/m.35312 type:complete len:431 (-) Transcript_22940:119-1411(-)|eukprot:CAMPEP_0196815548 /NCGR_PEP_ID=MMETSP1362-20130617/50456_1 /TAXON_ID=163516 /ORGANISM="Leptocylindrus danicus, Strain CCMP1856" /LENGTH=430 /DNA_ID=CAMNT_0042192541 /DNA_START=95 /DNA_END=1387 /DNA_ORIENTATION=-